MALDLSICKQECFGCIKGYKKKHTLRRGGEFEIKCNGIPDLDSDPNLFQGLSEKDIKTAKTVLDPVAWAAEVLDWHCLDPDGEIWKRKNPQEYHEWREANPDTPILNNSRYHRPYQAEMLRCTSKRKVFRVGRQAGKTEAIVVSMLFHLFIKPGIPENEGFEIIVITPYQSQIDLIFTRLLQLIRGSGTSRNSIKRNVKAPIYTLELYNGSKIKGFTAGTKSGGNAEAVRGQHGNMLVFDEADYLNKGDIDAAMSIITNYPNASVWMSSTPSGKREQFFETCHSKIWKESFYPSTVNPMWNDDVEATFRDQLTELGYKHEIEAEFGEQEQGVFQDAYVQEARQDYAYGSIPRDPEWTYTIGVDWNDTAIGTTLAVLGFNPFHGIFTVVDKRIVSKIDWNQLAACQEIAELNRFWRPEAIYIDSGYGGTQYEILKKYGYDALRDKTRGPYHPDARLRIILKQYDFGSKIEVNDLYTGQKTKKPAKPFLVENLVRRFETGTIVYPASDEHFTKQLQGYIIDRFTQSGTPVYTATDEKVGDHFLDAVMLAAVAFTLEKTPFGKFQHSSAIQFSGRIGEKTDAMITPGDTVILPDPSRRGEVRETSKPDTDRTSIIREDGLSQSGKLPGNHLSRVNTRSPWSWPGWLRDEPAPRRSAKKGASTRNTCRPKRKNI